MADELTPEQNALLDVLISEKEARISEIQKTIDDTNYQLIMAYGAIEEIKRQIELYKRKRGVVVDETPQLSEVLKGMGITQYEVNELPRQGG